MMLKITLIQMDFPEMFALPTILCCKRADSLNHRHEPLSTRLHKRRGSAGVPFITLMHCASGAFPAPLDV